MDRDKLGQGRGQPLRTGGKGTPRRNSRNSKNPKKQVPVTRDYFEEIRETLRMFAELEASVPGHPPGQPRVEKKVQEEFHTFQFVDPPTVTRKITMSPRDYEPGDIIQGNCLPFCKIVSIPSQKGVICDGCFKCPKRGCSLKPCVQCEFMYYCSPECQNEDWKNGHKVECGSQVFQNSFEDKCSVEFRCQLIRALAYLKLNTEMAQKEFPMYDGSTRSFNDLSSLAHVKYSDSSAIHQVCVQLAKEITAEGLGHEDLERNKIVVLNMAGILATHAFGIYNKDETEKLGIGIYIEPSIFNHSCRPNAKFSSNGTRMEIRALAPIKKGEEPFISYMASHMDKPNRKAVLKSRYNFDCQCIRCSESDDSVDYKKLNDLIDFFNRCVLGIPTPNSWKQILAKHDEVIGMMKKIYNEYDDRVSNQYARVIHTLINRGKCSLTIPRIQELVEETRVHLKITYGEHHTDYLKFERAIASLNTKY